MRRLSFATLDAVDAGAIFRTLANELLDVLRVDQVHVYPVIGERILLRTPELARILMKLEVRDRVQAVVLAYESGVVAPGMAVDE